MTELHELTASQAVAMLRRRDITAEILADALVRRIAAVEPGVAAWELLDPELALLQARRIDALPVPPPLAGLPIGVKDVLDTADMPTACGTTLLRGRRPGRDAEVVARLRAAGAVILGKTVTTELAFFRPGKTRNPRDPSRTPGGSSSGSAAAVAARMVPAALGTQTAGSIVRPASFCGVVGLKPTHGLLSLDGVLPFAPSLDTVGFLVRSPGDLPLLLEAAGAGLPPAEATARPPRLGLCRTEQWPLAAPESRRAVEDVAARLARAGAEVREVDADAALAGLFEAQRTVMAVEAARSLGALVASRGAELSPLLVELVRTGAATPGSRYRSALRLAEGARRRLPGLFAGVDVLLTPAAVGEAPEGLSSTGDPALNRVWTLLGVPCLSLPAASGPHGLPVGVQLVAAHRRDLELARGAAWAAEALGLP
jgi:amidase